MYIHSCIYDIVSIMIVISRHSRTSRTSRTMIGRIIRRVSSRIISRNSDICSITPGSRMIRNGAGCCPVFDVRGMLKDFTHQI